MIQDFADMSIEATLELEEGGMLRQNNNFGREDSTEFFPELLELLQKREKSQKLSLGKGNLHMIWLKFRIFHSALILGDIISVFQP